MYSSFYPEQMLELNDEQRQAIQECLWIMESFLGLHFDTAIFDHIREVQHGAGAVSLCEGGKARGIYVVESGEMDIVVEEVAVDMLGPGDFCGELSALFQVPQFIKASTVNGYG